jgi:hypothetical protein
VIPSQRRILVSEVSVFPAANFGQLSVAPVDDVEWRRFCAQPASEGDQHRKYGRGTNEFVLIPLKERICNMRRNLVILLMTRSEIRRRS